MKVKSVAYSMLRVVRQYENDRVEITVELEKGDKLADVVAKVKADCDTAIKAKAAPTCTCTNHPWGCR